MPVRFSHPCVEANSGASLLGIWICWKGITTACPTETMKHRTNARLCSHISLARSLDHWARAAYREYQSRMFSRRRSEKCDLCTILSGDVVGARPTSRSRHFRARNFGPNVRHDTSTLFHHRGSDKTPKMHAQHVRPLVHRQPESLSSQRRLTLKDLHLRGIRRNQPQRGLPWEAYESLLTEEAHFAMS